MRVFLKNERGQVILEAIAMAVVGFAVLTGAVLLTMNINRHVTRERNSGYATTTSHAAEIQAVMSYSNSAQQSMKSASAMTLDDGTVITPQNGVVMIHNHGAIAAIATK